MEETLIKEQNCSINDLIVFLDDLPYVDGG